ncbi:MAG: ribonuclease H-like domain-containing protein [Candidatus Woesearchaeota archaeon]
MSLEKYLEMDLDEINPLQWSTRKRYLKPLAEIIKEVSQVAKNVSEPLSKKSFRAVTYRQLCMWSFVMYGESNPAWLVEDMGFEYFSKKVLPYNKMQSYIKKRFTREQAEQAYTGSLVGKMTQTVFDLSDHKSKRIHKRVTREGGGYMAEFINSLYPDLQQKHGFSLYDAFINGYSGNMEDIDVLLTERHFSGASMFERSLRKDGLSYVVSALMKTSDNELFPKTFSQALFERLGYDVSADRFHQNSQDAQNGLSEKLGISSTRNIVSLAGERYATLLFSLLQRNPFASASIPEALRSGFSLVASERDKQLLVQVNELFSEDKQLVADNRVVTSNGSSVLVETKTLSNGYYNVGTKIIDKYASSTHWADGTPIDQKLAVFHANGFASEAEEELKKNGWQVFSGNQFHDVLGELIHKEEGFLDRLSVPLTSLDDLLLGHEIVNKRSHLLYRRPHKLLREWMVDMLEKNISSLGASEKTYFSRNIPFETVTSVREFEGVYDLSSFIKPNQPTVYFDLETPGFLSEGVPIGIAGVAYWQGDELVAKQFLARTPLEETRLLNELEKIFSQAKRVVTFNGERFDNPFYNSRAWHNLVRSKIVSSQSVDRMQIFKHERGIFYDQGYRLQDYEREHIGLVRSEVFKEQDIRSSDIPPVFKNYWYGGPESGVLRVLLHNQLDVFSTAMIDSTYLLRKPSSVIPTFPFEEKAPF